MTDDEIDTSDIPPLTEEFAQHARVNAQAQRSQNQNRSICELQTQALQNIKTMQDEYDFSQGTWGAIDPTLPGKTRITIRLDDDVIAWFREQAEQIGGGNYQTTINQVLRDYIEQRSIRKTS